MLHPLDPCQHHQRQRRLQMHSLNNGPSPQSLWNYGGNTRVRPGNFPMTEQCRRVCFSSQSRGSTMRTHSLDICPNPLPPGWFSSPAGAQHWQSQPLPTNPCSLHTNPLGWFPVHNIAPLHGRMQSGKVANIFFLQRSPLLFKCARLLTKLSKASR